MELFLNYFQVSSKFSTQGNHGEYEINKCVPLSILSKKYG